MFKENYYNSMGNFEMTHPFAEERDSVRWGKYYHAGIDWISNQGKRQDIYNLLAGQVIACGSGRDYGRYIMIKHNLKYLKGVDDKLYSIYCHLSVIDEDVLRIRKTESKFINAGEILGKMGNTGNCLTKGLRGYRSVTEKEVLDINCFKGVHLHQQFYQIVEEEEKTSLLKELINTKIIDSTDHLAFWQWGKLMINPEAIVKYCMLLQGRKYV